MTNIIYAIISRVLYVSGIVFMFLPIFSGNLETRHFSIPIGLVMSIVGFLLMGRKNKKTRKPNDNILDDGELY